MLRWIVIALVFCLPLRGALAAAQYCPWMANMQSAASMQDMAVLLSNTGSEAGDMGGMGGMDDGCPGMSTVDGTCMLETACFATPLIPAAAVISHAPLLLQTPAWQASIWTNFSPQAPLRVPIFPL